MCGIFAALIFALERLFVLPIPLCGYAAGTVCDFSRSAAWRTSRRRQRVCLSGAGPDRAARIHSGRRTELSPETDIRLYHRFVGGAYVTGKIAGKSKAPSYKRLFAATGAGLAVIYITGILYFYVCNNYVPQHTFWHGNHPALLFCHGYSGRFDFLHAGNGAFQETDSRFEQGTDCSRFLRKKIADVPKSQQKKAITDRELFRRRK